MNIRYGATLVFQHAYTTAETMQLLVPRTQFENGTFDPASRQDPHALLVGTKNLWGKIDTLPATHGVLNASVIAATATSVQAKLVLLQRAFYAQVSQRFVRAGDPVQQAGQVLDGSKLIWQAFVTAGLPLRIEANETLRSLLYGGDAILSGSDADGGDSLLDDVQDLYAFFSGRTEDPPAATSLRRSPPSPSTGPVGSKTCWRRSSRTSRRLANLSRRRFRADPAPAAAAGPLIRRITRGPSPRTTDETALIRPQSGPSRAQRTK